MNSDWTTVINKRDKQKGNKVISLLFHRLFYLCLLDKP